MRDWGLALLVFVAPVSVLAGLYGRWLGRGWQNKSRAGIGGGLMLGWQVGGTAMLWLGIASAAAGVVLVIAA